MPNPVLSFFEYEKLKFNNSYRWRETKDEIKFSDATIIALRKLHTDSAGLYFDLIDNGIQFKEYVGVIQVNGLTLEILPKIDKVVESDEREGAILKWHRILLDMIKECKFLLPESADYASLKLKYNSVLELYFEVFVVELERLLHQGLIKKYHSVEGNNAFLKGRIIFNKHIDQNLVHAERFYTRHTVYDRKHKIHQILRQALIVTQKLSGTSKLVDRINTLLTVWPESAPVTVSEEVFRSIILDRKTNPYKEALFIAEMILLNYHPDLKGGNKSVLSLMFNMNDLWESFILTRLKAIQEKMNWHVNGQAGMKYWTGDSGTKKLIPDILITCKETGKTIVIDTKWKCPKKSKPDDHDLRQLLAYKLYYHADLAFLLYPTTVNEGYIVEGLFQQLGYSGNKKVFNELTGFQGGMMFLNVLTENNVLINRKQFAEQETIMRLKI